MTRPIHQAVTRTPYGAVLSQVYEGGRVQSKLLPIGNGATAPDKPKRKTLTDKAAEFAAAHKQLLTEGRVSAEVAYHRLRICTGRTALDEPVSAPCGRYRDEKHGWGTGHCRGCGCPDWPVSQMHVEGKGMMRFAAGLGLVPGRAWFPIGCPIGRFAPMPGRRAEYDENVDDAEVHPHGHQTGDRP